MARVAAARKLDLLLPVAETPQLLFGMCAVAMRATDALFIQGRGLVGLGKGQAACPAQLVVARTQAVPHRYPLVEDEAFAFPAALHRRHGLEVLEHPSVQMIDLVVALRAQVGG